MDIETLPQGGDGAAAPQELKITDERSAGRALEGLLDFGDASGESGETNSGASAQDDGAGETPPTGEDEGHSEPPAKPAAIEPPASWSAEDKALFSKLPPEAQAVVARRESERDKLITARTQEIADTRKAAEAERAAIATQQQQYLHSLNQLAMLALPEAQQFQNVDWAKLAAEQPAEYVRLNGLREQLRGRVGAIAGEIQRVEQQQQQERQKQTEAFLGEQRQLLVAKVPEFGDAEKGAKLSREMGEYLQQQGFTQQEIGNAADHRLVVLALKAMRADQADAARKAAEAKRANPAPTVQRPGSAPAAEEGPGRRMQEKIRQLGRTNSVRDAASILEDLL